VYASTNVCNLQIMNQQSTPNARPLATLIMRKLTDLVKWKVAAIVSTSLLLLGIVGAGLYLGGASRLLSLSASLQGPAVVSQIQRLSQLATVRYTVERVVGLNEPRSPFGEESILLMVEGQAVAGVDLSCLTSKDLSFIGGERVSIRLPPAKLIGVYLDEKQTKVWDRHITWWTPWVANDPDLETKARLSALDDVRSAVLRMGILDDAQRTAQMALANFFRTLHLEPAFTGSNAS
jgi:Protein of unknown function (DUF4230)